MNKEKFMLNYKILQQYVKYDTTSIRENDKIPYIVGELFDYFNDYYNYKVALESLGYENVINLFIDTLNLWLAFFQSNKIATIKKDKELLENYKKKVNIALNVLKEIKKLNISNEVRFNLVNTLDNCEKVSYSLGLINIFNKNPTGDTFIDNSRTYGTIALIVGIVLFVTGLSSDSEVPSIIGFIVTAFSFQFVFAGR